jgi:hypothetical protein
MVDRGTVAFHGRYGRTTSTTGERMSNKTPEEEKVREERERREQQREREGRKEDARLDDEDR